MFTFSQRRIFLCEAQFQTHAVIVASDKQVETVHDVSHDAVKIGY